jgi:hypothetical protein
LKNSGSIAGIALRIAQIASQSAKAIGTSIMQSLPRLSTPIALISLFLICATYCVNAMDRIVFPVLLPAVAKDYSFSLTDGGLLATIFTLGLGVAGIPGG